MPDPDQGGDWLALSAAAARLGIGVDTLRSRARRGQVNTRKGNDGRVRVWVADNSGTGPDQGGPAPDQDDDRSELAAELVEARIALARVEAQLAATIEGKDAALAA